MDFYSVTCDSCGSINRIPADKQGKSGRCGNCHAALVPMYYQPQALNEQTFDAFLAAYHGPALVEFWAPTCPHCISYIPVVRKAAEILAGKAVVTHVNTQDNPHLAGRFGVRGVPVVYLFLNARIAGQLPGAQSVEALLAWFHQRQ